MWEAPAFDVVAHAQISVNIAVGQDYGSRNHSRWNCDAREEGRFQWFETAFMVRPGIPQRGIIDPFTLNPGKEAAQALWRGLGSHQVACPFEPLHASSLEKFIDRWASWFADAVSGRLAQRPDYRAILKHNSTVGPTQHHAAPGGRGFGELRVGVVVLKPRRGARLSGSGDPIPPRGRPYFGAFPVQQGQLALVSCHASNVG